MYFLLSVVAFEQHDFQIKTRYVQRSTSLLFPLLLPLPLLTILFNFIVYPPVVVSLIIYIYIFIPLTKGYIYIYNLY